MDEQTKLLLLGIYSVLFLLTIVVIVDRIIYRRCIAADKEAKEAKK